MHNDIEKELELLDTRPANLPPDPIQRTSPIMNRRTPLDVRDLLGVAMLARTLHSSLILAEVDEDGCEANAIRDAGEEGLRGLVQLVVETLLSKAKDVSNARRASEALHVTQAVDLGVRGGELGGSRSVLCAIWT